ncbi:hypothetical protein C8F04DRAFT_1183751 [Mycena alexandri]|uniref:Uncharacterized protein n=1 Tax=Mycena alexandri TaxID=1745969 RepID=A0AAD6STX2_9AGAR|nr:hypothetical protein C8F04DRAFT_1183751 [Mycena alexandri]
MPPMMPNLICMKGMVNKAGGLVERVEVLSETWEISITAIKLRAIVGGIAFSFRIARTATMSNPLWILERNKMCTRKPSAKVMEEEELLMEESANAAEDEISDDGGIEIDSDDEFRA